MSRARLAALASGLAVVAFGTVLLLQQESAIGLEDGWLAAALAACAGLALLASGIGAREE